MRISKEVYKQYPQYLHDMAVAQVAEEYQSRGYKVEKEYPIGKYHADLFARKNGESIVFEIKAQKLDDHRVEKLKFISRFVKENGYRFKVVIANTPRERKIDLPELKSIFEDYFQKNPLNDLAHLAEKVVFYQVNSVEVDELKLTENADIQLTGVGSVEVELIDPKDYYTESFPFEFEIILAKKNEKLVLKKILKLEFNTDDF